MSLIAVSFGYYIGQSIWRLPGFKSTQSFN